MSEISLAVIDGTITTTSNQVAENFGKQHKDVLRKIANLDCSEEFSQRNFAPSEYFDERGKLQRAYRLTRDGFTFLAMGFTGKEAARWKEAYIGAFNAMEAELRDKAAKVGAGATAAAPKALPSRVESRATQSAINRRAWQLAHEAYEDYRARMAAHPMVQSGVTQPEQWEPVECSQGVLEMIEIEASVSARHAVLLRDRGRRLAAMVGKDFDQAVAKLIPPHEKAARIGQG